MKRISRIKIILFYIFILFSTFTFSQNTKKNSDWKPFHFLLGEWIGEGNGAPGQGSGTFSFDFDLQKQILVRKSYANYPATKDKPAYFHDDLTIIYKQPDGSVHAIYFDNEGHIINYSVIFSDDHNSLIFISDIIADSPRYRFTYAKVNNQKLNIKFEIASSTKPGAFTPYLEGAVHRK